MIKYLNIEIIPLESQGGKIEYRFKIQTDIQEYHNRKIVQTDCFTSHFDHLFDHAIEI